LSEEELIEKNKDVHMKGVRSKSHITEKIMEAADKMFAVRFFCIGTKQVNLKAAAAKGVGLFNSPYSNTRSVAELVLALSILLIRKIPDKNRAAHDGYWQKASQGSHELRGKTLGIGGYGNIGSQVSVLAQGLGLKVIYYDVVS